MFIAVIIGQSHMILVLILRTTLSVPKRDEKALSGKGWNFLKKGKDNTPVGMLAYNLRFFFSFFFFFPSSSFPLHEFVRSLKICIP
jgi:hypothetical protein